MSEFRRWISSRRDVRSVDLFDTDGLVVATATKNNKRRLLRSPAMERAVIELVAEGQKRPEWRGLLYVMAWGSPERLRPLYIGKAGRFGKKPGELSANLKNLESDRGKFARWGDGNAYHIGDLSQALFGWSAYKDAGQKYERWAEVLFTRKDPPTLRERTHLILVPWDEGDVGPNGTVMTLEQAEEAAIDLALSEFEDIVLNVQGEQWWAPAAAATPTVAKASGTTRPYRFVATADALAEACRALAKSDVIGLDVETTLWGQKRLCLIQCATRHETFVIDPLAVQDLSALVPLLTRDGPLKIIHNAAFERTVFADTMNIDVGPVFDTLTASRGDGPGPHKLAAVVLRKLGRVMDKSEQVSDWTRRPLTAPQLEYAAMDAEVMLELHDVFKDAPLFKTR